MLSKTRGRLTTEAVSKYQARRELRTSLLSLELRYSGHLRNLKTLDRLVQGLVCRYQDPLLRSVLIPVLLDGLMSTLSKHRGGLAQQLQPQAQPGPYQSSFARTVVGQANKSLGAQIADEEEPKMLHCPDPVPDLWLKWLNKALKTKDNARYWHEIALGTPAWAQLSTPVPYETVGDYINRQTVILGRSNRNLGELRQLWTMFQQLYPGWHQLDEEEKKHRSAEIRKARNQGISLEQLAAKRKREFESPEDDKPLEWEEWRKNSLDPGHGGESRIGRYKRARAQKPLWPSPLPLRDMGFLSEETE